MITDRPTSSVGHGDHRDTTRDDPPMRLAHVLFVLWVAGSVGWAFYAARLAHDLGWWVQHTVLAAVLVLTPPILAHLLAIIVVKRAGNPRMRW